MDIKRLIANNDVSGLAAFAKANDLILRDGHLVARNDEAKRALAEQATFYNGRQQARKIL